MKATFQYLMLTVLVLGGAYLMMTAITDRVAGSLNASAAMIEERTR